MFRTFVACLIAGLLAYSPVAADTRHSLGWGRLFTNDFLGDNMDRYRTGSYLTSKVLGYGWNGERPGRPGEIIEFRFQSEVMAPASLSNPKPGDRRWAGALSFGVHTHFQRAGAEISMGGDLVITGPQNGIGSFQREVHKIVGATVPNAILNNQIPNGFHPTATVEVARVVQIAPNLSLRPFIEARAGDETLIRVGGDLTVGRLGQGELLLRDKTTGHRVRAVTGDATGTSFVIGADIAHVEHSIYLPVYDGYQLTDSRSRIRAGFHWQGEKSAVFYGLTWLGEEFTAQADSQIVGSVRLDIRF